MNQLAAKWRAEADQIDADLAMLRREEAAGNRSAKILLHGRRERQQRAMMRRDTLLECAAMLEAEPVPACGYVNATGGPCIARAGHPAGKHQDEHFPSEWHECDERCAS